MFSYDGVHFDRRYREAFIRPGHDPKNWHERAIEVGPGLVPTGPGEMSLYYMEHYRTDSVQIRRGVLRIDGLVSVQAGAGGGEIVTRPMTLCREPAGDELLHLGCGERPGRVAGGGRNAAGGIRRWAIAQRFMATRSTRWLAWKTGSDLTSLAGRPVRVRLVFQDADLYSFRFVTQ